MSETCEPIRSRPRINSREKGANAEREFSRLVLDYLGVRLTRNLEQSRAGGHDLSVDPDAFGPVAAWLGRHAFEVKRHAQASPGLLKAWWGQATAQASDSGLIPALAYRADRQPWLIVLPLCSIRPDLPPWSYALEYTAQLSVPAFAAVVRESTPPPETDR